MPNHGITPVDSFSSYFGSLRGSGTQRSLGTKRLAATRTTSVDQAGATSPPTPESEAARGVARVGELVASIRNVLQQRVADLRFTGRDSSTLGQATIDTALVELAQWVRHPLRPGGAGNAVVGTFDRRKIAEVVVNQLPPNATLQLSGRVVNQTTLNTSAAVVGPRMVTSNPNPSQIASIDASALRDNSNTLVSGTVASVQSAAELSYQGAAGSVVSGNASFRLTGPQGNVVIGLTQGESLADVAQRVNDQLGTTGVSAEVLGDSLRLFTADVGSSATLVIDQVVRESQVQVSGVNYDTQIQSFTTIAIPDDTAITLTGTIDQSSTAGTLTYLGAGGAVVDTASFTLTGNLGSALIAMTQGESLDDVATRINGETANTGITASTSGDELIFTSSNTGATANVGVALESQVDTIEVTGLNENQVTDFQVISAAPDSVNTLAANVTQEAGQAELTYQGFLGRVLSNATFTLSGSLGSAEIDVGFSETLTSVRDQINTHSLTTGVSASVAGSTLTLTSVDVGSAATIGVTVTDGSFNVDGGDGNGTAQGIDAELEINGQSIVANGNDVSFSDALGSYSFTLVPGNVGFLDPITVTQSHVDFVVVGGNGSGYATGTDPRATINGQLVQGVGNVFEFSLAGAQFSLEIIDGFTGALDPIDITSTTASFALTGGDGNGTAQGSDFLATINGHTLGSADGRFTVPTGQGDLVVTFAEGFFGAFDPFSVGVRRSIASSSTSVDRQETFAVINGRTVRPTQGWYHIQENGLDVSLRFTSRFVGSFDAFSIAAATPPPLPAVTPLSVEIADVLRPLLDPLFALASSHPSGRSAVTLGESLALTTSILQIVNPQSLVGYDSQARYTRTNEPTLDWLV